MERRLTRKIETHQLEFKQSIKEWLQKNEFYIYDKEHNDHTSMFLQYIFDYTNIELSKEDFQKRKRTKNIIPNYERCTAKRANGEQCSRRKMNDTLYCGTHLKGTPHGIIDNNSKEEEKKYTIEIHAEDINGIIYYIDNNHNVYHPEDIVSNKVNPRCIAKWNKDNDGNYCVNH